jgi:hypothetical protein
MSNDSVGPGLILWQGYEVTAKKGLLWIGTTIIDLPEADHIAQHYGYSCAERLVKALMQGVIDEKRMP